MRNRKSKINTDLSPFLGIFEGKAKTAASNAAAAAAKAKADADIQVIEAQNRALSLQLEAAKQGYDPAAAAADAAIKVEETKASSTNTMYYAIGAAVVAVMAGLYFITKK